MEPGFGVVRFPHPPPTTTIPTPTRVRMHLGRRRNIFSCFLKCSKTYLQHRRTCFIASSFTLYSYNASAARSTGEFLSRRSHNRDICSQTEGFVPDVQGRIEIALIDRAALFAPPLAVIEREVF